jgi:hypothetical protein
MTHEIEKQEVIEPEVFDENGQRLDANAPKHNIGSSFGGFARGLLGFVGGTFAALAGIAAFVLFAFIALVVAIPFLILGLFGRKPNIKVFKYKI